MASKAEQAENARAWAAEWVKRHNWTFAKTMSSIPHEWLVSKDWPAGKEKDDFRLFCHAITYYGYPKRFFSKTYTYFDVDGYHYWIMADPDEAWLINRAKI